MVAITSAIFNYGSATVRTMEQDGDIWFVAKDIL